MLETQNYAWLELTIFISVNKNVAFCNNFHQSGQDNQKIEILKENTKILQHLNQSLKSCNLIFNSFLFGQPYARQFNIQCIDQSENNS